VDLIAAKNLTMELLKKHGLHDWIMDFNHSRKSFGNCWYRVKKVSLSAPLVTINPEERVKDTVLHEIAHGIVGPGHDHDHVWESKFQEIGGSGRARWSEEETIPALTRFELHCKVHGLVKRMTRRPKHPMSCSQCCRRFDRRYLLEVRENHAVHAERRRLAVAKARARGTVEFHSRESCVSRVQRLSSPTYQELKDLTQRIQAARSQSPTDPQTP